MSIHASECRLVELDCNSKEIILAATYGTSLSAYLSILFDVGGIVGAIAAGLVSDYTGMSALTCVIMFGLTFPTVSPPISKD